MRSLRVWLLPLFTIALIATGSAAAAGCRVASVSGADKPIPEGRLNQALLDKVILAHINYERCRRGLPALKADSGLRKVSSSHAGWMAKAQKLSHHSTVSGRRSLSDRLKRSGVRYRTGAENIGMFHYYQLDGRAFLIKSSGDCRFTTHGGTPLPRHTYASLGKSAVSYWMASPGHRKNIMIRKLKWTGTGASLNRRGEFCGTIFMTQAFAG